MAKHILHGWSSLDPARRHALSDPTEKSVLTVGDPGSGKSGTVAIPNQIRCENSMVICDFNSELAAATSLWRSAVLGQDVKTYDPMRSVDPKFLPKDADGNVSYLKVNPIDFIRKARNRSTMAFSLAESFIPEGGLQESHWAVGAQGYLVALMLFLAFDPWIDQMKIPRNMGGLWMILSDPELEQEVLLQMAGGDDPFVADQASAFLNRSKDNREMEGIRSQIRVACGKLFSEPGILESMSETNVDFADLRRKPMTIYLCMPGNMAVTHNKPLRVIFKLALDMIEADGRRDFGDESQPPMVIFQADEFPVLGNFRPFADGPARYRGWGIKFHLLCQNLAQIASKRAYGDEWQAIMGNIGTLQVIGGTNSWFSAETISRLSGTETRPGVVLSGNREVNSPNGFSLSTYGRPLYMPDEVMRMPLPRQLLLRSGHAPVEAYSFGYGQADFVDYLAFMEALKRGKTVDEAARFAEYTAELARKER